MPNIARAFFAATGMVAAIGILAGLWNGYSTGLRPFPGAGFTTTYGPGLPGFLIQLAFFTLWSNIILGLTCFMLARKLARPSNTFHGFRLAGLGMIIITFLVTQGILVPNGSVHLVGVAAIADLLLHKLSPTMAVAGWLIFGPRRTVTLPRVVLATLIPLAYTLITLIRGKLAHWYPYPILDVSKAGYHPVIINAAIITAATILIYIVLYIIELVYLHLCINKGRISRY
jgi:hypothetical protein